MSFCTQCGFEVQANAKFCMQCGAAAPSPSDTSDDMLGLKVQFDAEHRIGFGLAVLPLAFFPSGKRLRDARVTLTSAAWPRAKEHRLSGLEAGIETVVKVPVEPDKTGETMFALGLTVFDEDGVPYCFSGQGGPIQVGDSLPSGPQISVDTEGAFVGDLSGASSGQINIKSEGMVVLNMDQYAESKSGRAVNWVDIPLVYEEARVEGLRQSLLTVRRCPYCYRQLEGRPQTCPACGIECPTYVHKRHNRLGLESQASEPDVGLRIRCLQTHRDHLIFTKSVVRMGRMRTDTRRGVRTNDVLLRLYPETGRNEQRSLLISRHHARLRVERERLRLSFLCATRIDGRHTDALKIRDGTEVPFLDVLSLRFRVFEAHRPRFEEADAEQDAPESYLLCCPFVRVDPDGPLQTYVVLRREATLRETSAGRLRWEEAGPTQFRLVCQDQCVWVDDPVGRGDVWVGDHRVARDEVVLLRPGVRIRTGEYSFEVSRLE